MLSRRRLAVAVCIATVCAGGRTARVSAWEKVGRELLLPTEHSTPAEVKAFGDKILIIHRQGVRMAHGGADWVAVLDGSGRELLSRAPGLDIPEAQKLASVLDATLTRDGHLVVAANLMNDQNQAANALLYYRLSDRSLIRVSRTSPVFCWKVAVDDGQNVWCLGHDVPKQMSQRSDYHVLYKFSPDGRLVGSYYDRSQFPLSINYFVGTSTAEPTLVIRGRQGYLWLPAVGALLSWSTDWTSVERQDLPARVNSRNAEEELTVTEGGRVLLLAPAQTATEDRRQWLRRVLEWDARTSEWTSRLGLSQLPFSMSIAGTDGADIVLWDRDRRSLVWQPLAP